MKAMVGSRLGRARLFSVLLALAVMASTAHATGAEAMPGIDSWWGNAEAVGGTQGGLFSVKPGGVAINDASGDVYVTDPGGGGPAANNRVQRFSDEGAFTAAWGKDVDAINPATGYEVCSAAPPPAEAGENCKNGATGALGGEFNMAGSGPGGIAVDQSTGNVYVIDPSNLRVQEFGAAGTFIRAFGGGVVIGGAEGSGTVVNGSSSITAATTAKKAFLVGQTITGIGIAPNTTITEVKATELKLSQSATPAAMGAGTILSVAQGGGNSPNNERQVVTVPSATTAGSFKLSFAAPNPQAVSGTQTTADIPFNATAGQVETALASLSNVGAGNVAVTLKPGGDPGGGVGPGGPWTVEFTGKFADTDVATFGSPSPALTPAGTPTVAVATQGASAAEVCEAAAECKAGTSESAGGAFASFGAEGSGLTVAPAVAPNAGNVMVTDPGNRRVEEFTSTGQFVRAFGWDVVAAGPDDTPANQFEVCTASAFDTCKAGIAGAAGGQFAASTPTRIAEDADGRIYTVEPTTNFRAQHFTLPGNVVTPQGEFATSVLHGTSAEDHTTEIAVDDAGSVYAVKAFLKSPTPAEAALLASVGSPPVVIEGQSGIKWQQRILKLDPVTEVLIGVMAANPGVVEEGNGQSTTFENVKGLAVGAAGTPLYATTATSTSTQARARAWRLNEIVGLEANNIHAEEIGPSRAKLKATITPAQITAVKRLGSVYRFEYSEDGVTWTAAPSVDARVGNGSGGGESSNCPTPEAAACNVSQSIAGLTPNITYQLRVALYTLFDKGQTRKINGLPFTTVAEPPVTVTGAAKWSSPASTSPSLSLGGTINPGHDRTTYQFQYVDDASFQADKASGDGFQHAAVAPVAPEEAGHGLADVSVHEVIAGLDPASTYHYRLAATNSEGASSGAERSVASPSAGERFYELVSAGEGWASGVEAKVGDIAADGNRATFLAQAFGDPRSVPNFLNPYISLRGPDGWTVSDTSPEAERSAIQGIPSFAASLGTVLWPQSSLAEQERSEGQFFFATTNGGLEAAGPGLVPLASRKGTGVAGYRTQGASTDLSTFVFSYGPQGSVALLPGEPLLANGLSNLYEINGAGGPSPTLKILNRASDSSPGVPGPIIGAACGASISDRGTHAVSNDGSVVYFTAFPECGSPGASSRLYKRINNEVTVEVSSPQCTPTPACPGSPNGNDEINGASADGKVVFFTTVRRLVNADTDSTSDLYAYDASPPAGQPNLVQVSGGETAGSHIAGSGANVLGTLDNAEDGSRAYFVAEGTLTAANGMGNTPLAGAKNLYGWERDAAQPAGRIAFLGRLTPGEGTIGDEREWKGGETGGKQASALPVDGHGGGDGHVLVFVSKGKLVGEDSDTSKDLYRYDDSLVDPAKQLICLSCKGAPGAAAGAGSGEFEVRATGRATGTLPDYAVQGRVASANLSIVVFTTKEKLSSEDENITWDAYAWHEGTIQLVSKGTEGFGIPETFNQVTISADGANVFFPTRAPLVGADTNGAYDLYDARVGGGFPDQARVVRCSSGESCQGAAPGAPTLGSPGSESFSGPTNETPTPACPRGKIRKRGKCVRKPPHKHGQRKNHNKRTSTKRGTGR